MGPWTLSTSLYGCYATGYTMTSKAYTTHNLRWTPAVVQGCCIHGILQAYNVRTEALMQFSVAERYIQDGIYRSFLRGARAMSARITYGPIMTATCFKLVASFHPLATFLGVSESLGGTPIGVSLRGKLYNCRLQMKFNRIQMPLELMARHIPAKEWELDVLCAIF